MARERWQIDGWELTDGFARDVESRDGLHRSAPMVGGNALVANRRGSLWRPKDIGEGTFVLNIWLAGTSRADWEAAWDALIRAVTHPERLLTFDRLTANGEWRRCYGEVTGAMEPQSIGQLAGRCTIEVTVPDGVWRTQGTFTDNASTPVTNGQVVTLTQIGASTAPVDEALFVFTGPFGSPGVLVPGVASETFSYVGSVPVSCTMTVNCADWSVTGTGWTPSVAALQHTGGGPYLTVPVASPGSTMKVQVSGANLTSASRFAVTSPRMYMV